MSWHLTIVSVASMVLLGGMAAAQTPTQPRTQPAARPAAQPGPLASTPGLPVEGRMAGRHRPNCAMLLMRGTLVRLKQRLDLSDAQLTELEAVRTPFLSTAVGLRGKRETYRVQLQEALSAELPDEATVLSIERGLRDLYAKYEEDGTKAYLKILRILTAQQRTILHQQCSTMGPPVKMMQPWMPGHTEPR